MKINGVTLSISEPILQKFKVIFYSLMKLFPSFVFHFLKIFPTNYIDPKDKENKFHTHESYRDIIKISNDYTTS